METNYKNLRQQVFLQNSKEMIKKYGQKNARLIVRRLEQLEAADSLKELPAFTGIHPLKGSRKGEYAVDLDNGCRLVFLPVEPYSKDDIATIKKIQIEEIKNYHKKS